MLFDVGSDVLSISDLGARADDGKYHVVRVTRDGPNSTLQLDNRPVQTKYPRGNRPIDLKERIGPHEARGGGKGSLAYVLGESVATRFVR